MENVVSVYINAGYVTSIRFSTFVQVPIVYILLYLLSRLFT